MVGGANWLLQSGGGGDILFTAHLDGSSSGSIVWQPRQIESLTLEGDAWQDSASLIDLTPEMAITSRIVNRVQTLVVWEPVAFLLRQWGERLILPNQRL